MSNGRHAGFMMCVETKLCNTDFKMFDAEVLMPCVRLTTTSQDIATTGKLEHEVKQCNDGITMLQHHNAMCHCRSSVTT